MNFDFIKKLLDAAEQFQQVHPGNTDLVSFGHWLTASPVDHPHPSPGTPAIMPGETLDSNIGNLLIFLNRYSSLYTKKTLDGAYLQSADEFIFLMYLLNNGPAAEMDIIEASQLGRPAGTMVIRRLLELGFITQDTDIFDDPNKNLTITDAGRNALLQSFEKMEQVSALITTNLSNMGKIQLYQLLAQLERFHRPIREKHQSSILGEERGATNDLFFIDPSSV